MDRSEVYAVIDTEREYQNELWGDGGKHEIDSFATYIRVYSRILDETATRPNTPQEKMNIVRKIAGLAVAAMEQHGAPRR